MLGSRGMCPLWFCFSSFPLSPLNCISLVYSSLLWWFRNICSIDLFFVLMQQCLIILSQFVYISPFQGVSSWFGREARLFMRAWFIAQWSCFHLNLFTVVLSPNEISWTYHWFQDFGQTILLWLSISQYCIWWCLSR